MNQLIKNGPQIAEKKKRSRQPQSELNGPPKKKSKVSINAVRALKCCQAAGLCYRCMNIHHDQFDS